MVGALTSLVDPTHKNATDSSNERGQYIPIPGTKSYNLKRYLYELNFSRSFLPFICDYSIVF